MAQLGIVKKKGNHARRRRNPGAPGPRPDLYLTKVKEAKERHAHWASLTPSEQLAALDRRLGKNVGAKKQRARIECKLADILAKKTTNVEVHVAEKSKKKLKAKDRRSAAKRDSK